VRDEVGRESKTGSKAARDYCCPPLASGFLFHSFRFLDLAQPGTEVSLYSPHSSISTSSSLSFLRSTRVALLQPPRLYYSVSSIL
jgi:hypothetical protein